MMYSFSKKKNFMNEALNLAKSAFQAGEVPVGAIIVDSEGNVLSKSENRMIRDSDQTSHAELICIKKAIKTTGMSRLINCDIWVTLEPCIMCAGAIIQARLRRVYFGAFDQKFGAIENGPCLFHSKNINHRPEVYGGIKCKISKKLLKDFFKFKRQNL